MSLDPKEKRGFSIFQTNGEHDQGKIDRSSHNQDGQRENYLDVDDGDSFDTTSGDPEPHDDTDIQF